MRALVVYASKRGATKKASSLLAVQFENATLHNIKKGKIKPTRYDIICVGSYIKNGQIDPMIREWLVANEEALEDKELGFFICNAFLEDVPVIFQENFPEEFLQGCVCYDSFGGELDLASLGFFEKLMLKEELNKYQDRGQSFEPCLLTDRIRLFAEKLKASFEEKYR